MLEIVYDAPFIKTVHTETRHGILNFQTGILETIFWTKTSVQFIINNKIKGIWYFWLIYVFLSQNSGFSVDTFQGLYKWCQFKEEETDKKIRDHNVLVTMVTWQINDYLCALKITKASEKPRRYIFSPSVIHLSYDWQ